MATNHSNPTPQTAGYPPAVQGIDLNKLQELLQALGQYGPVLFEMIQKLAELFRQPAMFPVREGPASPNSHTACCRAELEHLLKATAICLHHCHCCEQEDQQQGHSPKT
jgi:hypothetical protein